MDSVLALAVEEVRNSVARNSVVRNSVARNSEAVVPNDVHHEISV